MAHELPTEAQFTGATHAEVVQRQIYEGGKINVEVQYGTLDGNGNFVPREKTQSEVVTIYDREEYNNASTKGNAPETKGDPPAQARDDAMAFIDDKGLWPTQANA